MKTLAKLLEEKKQITKSLESEIEKKAQETKLRKRLSFILMCERYVATNPSEDFLKKELNRLNNRLQIINKDMPKFPFGSDPKYVAKKKQEYRKLMDVSDLTNKIQAVSFLLN